VGDVIKGPWEKEIEDLEPLEGLSDLEAMAAEERRQEAAPPLVACSDCLYVQDPRPWWRKLFSAPKPEDLHCRAVSLLKIRHPITGRPAYVASNLQVFSLAGDNPHPPCQSINLTGNCKRFRVHLTYRK